MLNITRGKIARAQKVVIYGAEGIGKTTFASKFPDPLFLDTEGSTLHYDVARIDPAPKSWVEILGIIDAVKKERPCKTFVVDTADWAEIACIEYLCIKKKWDSIESPGYGVGYTALKEEFGKFLNKLTDLVDAGINVVVTAHAMMRKFERPDEANGYDRWELKLQKKTAPLLKEWADVLLFVDYKTVVEAVPAGMGQVKGKARGGKRVMYAEHHPCWDAKNRWGLSGELEFDYATIAGFIEQPASEELSVAATSDTPTDGSAKKAAAPTVKMTDLKFEPAPPVEPTVDEQHSHSNDEQSKVESNVESSPDPSSLPEYWAPIIPLMQQDNITLDDIRLLSSVINDFFPPDMDPKDYPKDYIEQGLLGQWETCVTKIRNHKINQEPVPFN